MHEMASFTSSSVSPRRITLFSCARSQPNDCISLFSSSQRQYSTLSSVSINRIIIVHYVYMSLKLISH